MEGRPAGGAGADIQAGPARQFVRLRIIPVGNWGTRTRTVLCTVQYSTTGTTTVNMPVRKCVRAAVCVLESASHLCRTSASLPFVVTSLVGIPRTFYVGNLLSKWQGMRGWVRRRAGQAASHQSKTPEL